MTKSTNNTKKAEAIELGQTLERFCELRKRNPEVYHIMAFLAGQILEKHSGFASYEAGAKTAGVSVDDFFAGLIAAEMQREKSIMAAGNEASHPAVYITRQDKIIYGILQLAKQYGIDSTDGE